MPRVYIYGLKSADPIVITFCIYTDKYNKIEGLFHVLFIDIQQTCHDKAAVEDKLVLAKRPDNR